MKRTESVLELLQILVFGAAWHQHALSARNIPTFRVLFWWPCLELKLFYFLVKSAAWSPVCQIEIIGLSNRAPSNGVSIVILIYSTLFMFFLLVASKLYIKLRTAFVGYICVYSLPSGMRAFLSETGADRCNGVRISKEACAEEDHYYVWSNPKREQKH